MGRNCVVILFVLNFIIIYLAYLPELKLKLHEYWDIQRKKKIIIYQILNNRFSDRVVVLNHKCTRIDQFQDANNSRVKT